MPITKFGIVYGQKSGHVRRHVYADHDDAEFSKIPLLPGEATVLVDIAHHHAGHNAFHQAIRDAVKAHGGVSAVLFFHEPGSRLFARVNPTTMLVDNVTMADPDIDKNHESENWIEHKYGEAAVGHKYDPATNTFHDPNPPKLKTG